MENNDIPKPDFNKLRKQKTESPGQTVKVLFLKKPSNQKPSSGGRKITHSKQEDKNEVYEDT